MTVVITCDQVDGNIVGPSTLGQWAESCNSGCWLCFQNVKGLVMKGNGLINGKGSIWWNQNSQSLRLSLNVISLYYFLLNFFLKQLINRKYSQRYILGGKLHNLRHIMMPLLKRSDKTVIYFICISMKCNNHLSLII